MPYDPTLAQAMTKVLQPTTSTPAGYDPNLTSKMMDVLKPAHDVSSTLDPEHPVLGSNPAYNTTDFSTINKGIEASDSWFRNSYNDFWQSYYNTKLSTIQGKEEAGDALFPMPWSKLEGPAAILDNYPDRIKDLQADLSSGKIEQAQFDESMHNLDLQKSAAERQMADFQDQESQVKGKLASSPGVNKQFKLKQALTNQLGDAASMWDRAYYSAGNTIGSSASLMIPGFLATFGNKAAQNLIKVGIANAVPVAGEVADGVATVGALLGTVAETIWNRGQETYGEIEQPISDARTKLTQEYMKAHDLTSENDIPEEDKRQIRIQSRQGMEQQFRTNMMLTATDLGAAILMPFSNVGYGVGRLAKGASKALGLTEHLAEEAQYYGRFAKIASRVGKEYTEMQMEGYEEGLQQAAQGRADEANKTKMSKAQQDQYNSWGKTLTNTMQDGYDTISSIDLIPGQKWSNMGGKYANDPEFQSSVFGGQFLGMLMSAPLTGLAIGKDIQRFKNATKDLNAAGVIDTDGKFQNLRNNILEKYFKSGRVEYLAGALRDLKNAKDEDGQPLMEAADLDKMAKDVKDAYELYQEIDQHVNDRVGHDRMFGLFDSKELASAKDRLRTDIFNAATAITAHTDILANLDTQITAQQVKDGRFAMSTDAAEETKRNLESQIEATKEAIEAHENRSSEVAQYQEPHWANKLADHISTLTTKLKGLQEEYKSLDDDIKKLNSTPASAALTDLYKARTGTELKLADAKAKYAELGGVRTKSQLRDYVSKNQVRPVPAASPLNNTTDELEEEPETTTQGAPVSMTPLAGATVNLATPAKAAAQSARPSDPTPPAELNTAGTQVTQTAPPVEDDPAKEKARLGVQKDFRTALARKGSPETMGKELDGIFRSVYPELPAKLSMADAFYDMKEYWFADDPTWVKSNYGKIYDAINAYHPGQANLELDPNSMELSVVQDNPMDIPPPTQAGNWADDVNGKLAALIREANWEPGTPNMITNALSIAQLNTEKESVRLIDENVHGDYRDDKGELQYSEQSDQQLNNTNVVSIGDELTYRLDDLGAYDANLDARRQTIERQRSAALAEANKVDTRAKSNEQLANAAQEEADREERIKAIHAEYDAKLASFKQNAPIDVTDQSDNNYDQAVIGVYKTVETKSGANTISKEVRLGSLHKLSKLRKILSPTVGGAAANDIEAEIAKVRDLRQRIISSGTEVKATVTSKGFGYLNTRKEKTTIGTAIGKDTRPYLSVIDNTGRPIATRGTTSIEIKGTGLRSGAAVLMLPNGDVYIPVYVTKNTLSNDKNIHNIVLESVTKYLGDGAKKHLQAVDEKGDFHAEAYVYVTSNAKDLASMTPGSGIYAHYVTKGGQSVPAITIGANTFTADDSNGLKEAIGATYVNINRTLITGQVSKKYNESLRNSATLTTNVQANPVLVQRHDSGDYSFLSDNEQYSYFLSTYHWYGRGYGGQGCSG
jgi:hypothetical protein